MKNISLGSNTLVEL